MRREAETARDCPSGAANDPFLNLSQRSLEAGKEQIWDLRIKKVSLLAERVFLKAILNSGTLFIHSFREWHFWTMVMSGKMN